MLASPKLFSQKTNFSPFALEAKHFDDPEIKNGKIFEDNGTTYKNFKSSAWQKAGKT